MNIGDILKTVGTGIVKQVFPAAGAVIDVVNGFLGNDDKLPSDATGEQVQGAIDSLPVSDRASIMSKQIDLQIVEVKEWSNVVDSLAKSDAVGNSTRPFIALMMAWVVALIDVPCGIAYVYAVCSSPDPLKSIGETWPVLVAILGTPTALLRAYFGMRTAEKKARYAASTGQQQGQGIMGAIGSLFGKGQS